MKNSSSQKIRMNALDTLFFRDGRPFTMGDESWVSGIFLPYPSVVSGALRSAYFGENISKLKDAAANADPTNYLKIKTIALIIDEQLYFPMPLDCVKEKGEDMDKEAHPLSLFPCPPNTCSPFSWIAGYHDTTKTVENISDALIDIDTLGDYLNGQEDDIYYKNLSDHIISEPKIGIGRNNDTHSVKDEEGLLYRVDMRRLVSEWESGNSPTDIFVEFENLKISERGFMRLGGEGKAVSYEKVDIEDVPDPEISGSCFKLYFATPTFFEHGWLPKAMNQKTFIWIHNGLKLKLMTAVIGKPLHIGGFDMKTKRPKMMRRAVPAGSVYYFEILEGNIDNIIKTFHKQCITDSTDDQNQGFGLAFIGGIYA
jgi:CRISPR-associated protein Cmr3